jgi:hypothetical protein
MKILLTIISFILFLVNSVISTPVTNINAVYRYGQVFVTWDNNTYSDFFVLYKSSTPILTGVGLSSAQNLGKVSYWSAFNTNVTRFLRIDSASSPLSSPKGLFVSTTASNGAYYYAVTSVSNNLEDTSIVFGSNSLSVSVNETVGNPHPVWQFDTLITSKTFSVYVWFATKITSGIYPRMTNAGTYPLNFAIVKNGTQSPHPVTFWMRSSVDHFLNPNIWGTGDSNEWILSIDDFNPNTSDGPIGTMYYGYHQNYDIFCNGQNPVPDTGTIYNYTSSMVSRTIDWALRNLPVDSTKTYMTGFSLGAIGTVLNSFVLPSKIAAVFLYAPLFNAAVGVSTNPTVNNIMNRLYGTYQTNLFTNEAIYRNERLNANYLLSKNRLNSMPIIFSFCGKNDLNVGWTEKITFYDSVNVLKHGGYHFWSTGNHFATFSSNPWKIAAFPPGISFFTRYKTNLSYPAFSNCSVNNNPGNGTPTSGDSIGQINGHLDWNDNIIDTTIKWEIILKTKELVTVYDTLDAPDSCTADVTLRRLQKFNPATGHIIQWTNTRNNAAVQQGTFTYNGGLITIQGVKIYKLTNKLSLINTSVGINNIGQETPSKYSLYQNYPNPFNPNTIIRYQLPVTNFVTLKVYDILGKEIKTLVNEKLQPGTYEVTFDGSNLTSGIYFCKLSAGDFIETKRMLMIK